jgi:hypothetical protein
MVGTWRWVLVLVGAAVLVHGLAIGHPFLIDDHDAIVTHPHVAPGSQTGNDGASTGGSGGWLALWASDYWAGQTVDDNLYRPMTVLSFRVNRMVTGMLPVGFRVVNVGLLVGCGWVLGLLVTRGVGGEDSSGDLPTAEGVGFRGSVLAGVAVAVLFVVHPVHTEVVNHLVGRSDLQALLGVLAAVWAVRGLAAGARERRWSWQLMVVAGGGAAVAVFSKESGLVVLPVVLSAWWVGRGRDLPLREGGVGHPPTPEGVGFLGVKGVRGVGVVVGVCVVYAVVRVAAVGVAPDYAGLSDDLTGNPLRGLSLGERLPGSLAVAWWYAVSTVWPSGTFTQQPAEAVGWGSWRAWAGLGVLLAVSGGAVWALAGRRAVAVPLVLWLSAYGVVGNLLTPTGVWAANRLALPMVAAGLWGVALAVGGVARRWRGRRPPTPEGVGFGGRGVAWAWAAVGGVVLVAGGVTVWRHTLWADELTRMRADVAALPEHPVAAFRLGQAVAATPEADGGGLAAAMPRLRRAHVLRPESVQARDQRRAAATELAVRALRAGRAREGEALLDEAMGLIPPGQGAGADVLHLRAQSAYLMRDVPLAVRRYRALLRAYPGHTPGAAELGQILEAHPGAEGGERGG